MLKFHCKVPSREKAFVLSLLRIVLAAAGLLRSLRGAPADPERDDLGPPFVPGGQEIGLGTWDPETFAKGGGKSHGARRLEGAAR